METNVKKLVVLTGAGISAESGLALFRGSNGLWGRYKVDDVATIGAYVILNKEIPKEVEEEVEEEVVETTKVEIEDE